MEREFNMQKGREGLIWDGELNESNAFQLKLFEHVCQIMHENSGAVSMKSIGPNLAVQPDGDLPQVQICDSVWGE